MKPNMQVATTLIGLVAAALCGDFTAHAVDEAVAEDGAKGVVPWTLETPLQQLAEHGQAANLALGMARLTPVTASRPWRAGFHQAVGLSGMHAAATAVYWEGIPLHAAASNAVDLGLFPAALGGRFRLSECGDSWHPTGAATVELAPTMPTPDRVRTRLAGEGGWGRDMDGEEIEISAPIRQSDALTLLHKRHSAVQPLATWPQDEVLDASAPTLTQARALTWRSGNADFQSRVLLLSLEGSERPATLPDRGLRSTHIQRDDITLVGASAHLPSKGIAASLSTQSSSSELSGLNGVGSFAAIDETHMDGVLSWSGNWHERHHLRVTWRIQQSTGSSAYSNVVGENFPRHLRMQWWSVEDRIGLNGMGEVRFFGSRSRGTVTDYRFAPEAGSPSLSKTFYQGGGAWSTALGEKWSCALSASLHTRPLTYLEHLYLERDFALVEQGRSAHVHLRRATDDWEVETGSSLTYWSERARFTQRNAEIPYDWVVVLDQERQGALYVAARARRGSWNTWAGWQLDGGDLPGDSLWKHSLDGGATWVWNDPNRPLSCALEAALMAEHEGQHWHAALSGGAQIKITDDFRLRVDGRNLGYSGEIYGPQYSLALTWILWD